MATAALWQTLADLGGEAGIKAITCQPRETLTPECVLGALKVRRLDVGTTGVDRRLEARATSSSSSSSSSASLPLSSSSSPSPPSSSGTILVCPPWQLAALTWSLRKTEGMARLHLLTLYALGFACEHLSKTSPTLASKILPQVGHSL
jgi:hypothetical protein